MLGKSYHPKTQRGRPATQNLNFSDESLIQKQTEQEITPEEFIDAENTEDAVNSEDSILEDESLKPVEESNNIVLEGDDSVSDSTEMKPPEQNSVPVETTVVEENNMSAVSTEPEKNTEAEETEESSTDSSEE